jgi:hypothetical protein
MTWRMASDSFAETCGVRVDDMDDSLDTVLCPEVRSEKERPSATAGQDRIAP